jgi:hypothetical protein
MLQMPCDSHDFSCHVYSVQSCQISWGRLYLVVEGELLLRAFGLRRELGIIPAIGDDGYLITVCIVNTLFVVPYRGQAIKGI